MFKFVKDMTKSAATVIINNIAKKHAALANLFSVMVLLPIITVPPFAWFLHFSNKPGTS
jgi:phosphoribosylcarboxyaminoimidazole (NCAIR) mutase